MNRLPREFLWKDVESMDNFLHDPLNKELYKVYLKVKDAPFRILIPDVKVFNELYYLCVGLRFRDFKTHELEGIILADLGHTYSPSLLMSMLFAVYALQDIKIKESFPDHLDYLLIGLGGWYYDVFKEFVNNQTTTYQTDFTPRPDSASNIVKRNYDWEKITHSYNDDDLLRILGLWKKEEEKLIVLDAIEVAYQNYHNDGALIQKSDGSLIMPMDIDFQKYKEYIINHKPISQPAILCKDIPFTPEERELDFFSNLVLDSSHEESIIALIKSRLIGKIEPKDIMRPFRAAYYANAISRPKWKNFELTYGSKSVSKSSFNGYLAKTCTTFDDEQEYNWLLKEFNKIVG